MADEWGGTTETLRKRFVITVGIYFEVLERRKRMFQSMLKNFWVEEDGQDMVEYSLLLAFVALGATALGAAMKTDITTIWNSVKTQLDAAAS
jgi:Flp pilus assembly pilin Flp